MRKLLSSLFLLLLSLTFLLEASDIDINAIVKNSTKENKKVFIYLHIVGCNYCNIMDEFTFDDDSVNKYTKENFRVININASKSDVIYYKSFKGSGREFVKHTGYTIYPSVLFLGPNGCINYASLGYKDEKQFLSILKYIKTDAFKEMDLKEFSSRAK